MNNVLKKLKIKYTLKKTTTVKNKSNIIISIDNDECIGSWSDLSLIYSIIKSVMRLPINEEIVNMFVKLFDDTGCVRPNLKTLYDDLIKLKDEGKIDAICMFTSASDVSGWVSFLKIVLEKWYSNKIGKNIVIYDCVINGDDIYKWHIDKNTVCKSNTGIIKNMNMVREIIGSSLNLLDEIYVIMLDDRPENIVNGHAIGIAPYKVAVNLIEVVKIYLKKYKSHIDVIYNYNFKLNYNWHLYNSNPMLFTVNALEDRHIILCSEQIKKTIDANVFKIN